MTGPNLANKDQWLRMDLDLAFLVIVQYGTLAVFLYVDQDSPMFGWKKQLRDSNSCIKPFVKPSLGQDGPSFI